MNPQNKILKRGSCKVGETVFYNGKPVMVQKVLDYDPERRKSYIKGCAIDDTGRPLLASDVFPGCDWEFRKSS